MSANFTLSSHLTAKILPQTLYCSTLLSRLRITVLIILLKLRFRMISSFQIPIFLLYSAIWLKTHWNPAKMSLAMTGKSWFVPTWPAVRFVLRWTIPSQEHSNVQMMTSLFQRSIRDSGSAHNRSKTLPRITMVSATLKQRMECSMHLWCVVIKQITNIRWMCVLFIIHNSKAWSCFTGSFYMLSIHLLLQTYNFLSGKKKTQAIFYDSRLTSLTIFY